MLLTSIIITMEKYHSTSHTSARPALASSSSSSSPSSSSTTSWLFPAASKRHFKMAATVASLHVSEGSMRPMVSKQRVRLVPGCGIEGDRYATGNGTYQAFHEPGRQLTVISGDSAEASICGLPRTPAGGVGDLRRNVVVTGMTAGQLNDAVGSNLKLGADCVVLVHRRRGSRSSGPRPRWGVEKGSEGASVHHTSPCFALCLCLCLCLFSSFSLCVSTAPAWF